MAKIFIITDDSTVKSILEENLSPDFELVFSDGTIQLSETFKNLMPDITIIDFDCRKQNGMEIFKKLKRIEPKLKVIMLSERNNVAVAVAATKMGVQDFLNKPIAQDSLKSCIERVLLSDFDMPFLSFGGLTDSGWMLTSNKNMVQMLKTIEDIAGNFSDVLIFGEKGTVSSDVAQLLHNNSYNRAKKFIPIDMSSFSKEEHENYFWVMIRELLEEKCGTVYLDGLENLSEHFRNSVLEFLSERKKSAMEEKIDKTIRVMISIFDPVLVSNLENSEMLKSFSRIDIPPLRDRKEDIPAMVNYYLKIFASKYCKKVLGLSPDVLELFGLFDWPGNDIELKNIIETAVIRSDENIIGLKDLVMSADTIVKTMVKRLFVRREFDYSNARDDFQKDVLNIVLEKSGWNKEKTAEFLDIPKTVLSDMMYSAGLSTKQI